ncbi:MAG: aspartyl protease family protein [Thermofilum sp.]|jgi:predicted aspartyl protease|uniref:aspartyl protease family protein n=1 Tax=Thermofilum sp. TaxID=1961369 RepID=UPI0025843FD6|nr:aspartyl protease family protein [Thermofilum sp.]MCI4408692.1 aspartyl protease family protein [Thermofilum sp.]
MGVFKVNAWVWNPSTPEKKVLLELLVDTGATYTVLPESLLKSLGVKPLRVARLRLADNRILEKSLGEVGIEVEGYRASATPVVFGEEEVYLLGSVTMEQLGLAPDPIAKRLKPVEALLM